jgi:hypothetical protein
MSLDVSPSAGKHRKLFYYSLALVLMLLVTAAIFAKNGWFPSTDAISGKRTGWFGQQVAKNAPSSWNPLPMFTPTPTPLPLSKEYLYAGSRLLAVEDANATAVPPSDLAIFRPNAPYGDWWILNGSASGSYTTWSSLSWGAYTDTPVLGDFDGDGKTDFAIVRDLGSGGGNYLQWWVLRSSDMQYYAINYGDSGDIPVPADYDGDGKTDIAVYRPSNLDWYVYESATSSNFSITFGYSGSKPAPADFDGDGKGDLGIWRDSNKTFYSINSTDNSTVSFTFSQNSSEPVPSDYDGDGKADYAIRESGTSNWVIRYSGSSTTSTISWQNSSDKAVQNDYDGDGKCDIAVWRDSNANWYIRQSASSGSLRQVGWGQSGDIPVPAYFRR